MNEPDHLQINSYVTALESRDERTRDDAIEALTRIGSPAVPPLLAALRDAGKWYGASYALAKIGPPAVGPLIEELRDPVVANFAFDALTRMGDLALDQLTEALRGEPDEVRPWIIMAIGSMHAPQAVVVLRNALHDSIAEVRYYAIEALERHVDKEAIPMLRRLRDTDPDPRVVRAAKEAVLHMHVRELNERSAAADDT